MKILEKDGKYQKVPNDFIADEKVKKLGWRYSSRAEWKKNVRDFDKKKVVEVKVETTAPTITKENKKLKKTR